MTLQRKENTVAILLFFFFHRQIQLTNTYGIEPLTLTSTSCLCGGDANRPNKTRNKKNNKVWEWRISPTPIIYAVAKICYEDKQQTSIHQWPVTSPMAYSRWSLYIDILMILLKKKNWAFFFKFGYRYRYSIAVRQGYRYDGYIYSFYIYIYISLYIYFSYLFKHMWI